MVAVVARCAVCGHVALTAFFVALKAVDSHPLAVVAMPNHVDIVLDMQDTLQRGLVLPWALLIVCTAAVQTICFFGRVLFSALRGLCNSCFLKKNTIDKSRSPAEEKDNGPPRAVTALQSEKSHTQHKSDHLRRRTYPKLI